MKKLKSLLENHYNHFIRVQLLDGWVGYGTIVDIEYRLLVKWYNTRL